MTKKTPERTLNEPINENAIHGDHIGFTELLDTNISVIKQRIKTPELAVEYLTVGRIAPTAVALVYLHNTADIDVVARCRAKIASAMVDYAPNKKAVMDEISSPWNGDIFPDVRETERVDSFVSDIMQGRVGVIVDNNPFGLVVPSLFLESFHSADDYYTDYGQATARIYRVMGFALACFLPAVLIAMVCHHLPEMQRYAPKTFEHKANVPYIWQVVTMLIIYRNLFDVVQRANKYLTFFVALVASTVVGQIGVEAELFDPVVIVVGALSIVAGMQNMLRLGHLQIILRSVTLAGAYFFGYTGIIIPAAMAFLYACCLRSFGVPYLSPLIPFRPHELMDSVFYRGRLARIINRKHRYKKT